mmetsp:Transcript_25959/g.65020  ORF Transcript_25959/g.65020 Transcript_25959/m.65020 type:complete len:397 (-) Transcript_25959:2366-3556(-)
MPVAWSTSSRQGDPRAPDASVSPNPTATSASSVALVGPAAAADAPEVVAVWSTNDTREGAISWTSTAMCADAWGTPAARRASTARRLYRLAHTSRTASPSSAALEAETPSTDSYRPAADMPAKSSTLAELRTTTRAAPFGSGNAAVSCAASSGGKGAPATSWRTARHAASIAAGSPPAAAVSVAATNSTNASALPAPLKHASIAPNGRNTPAGALNPELGRSATRVRSPQVVAFAPHCAKVASLSGRHSITSESSTGVICTGAAAAAAAAASAAPPAAVATSVSVAGASETPLAVTRRMTCCPRRYLAARCASLSSVAVSGTFSWRARMARWLRCGRSRAKITPRTCRPAAETSSSPSAPHTSAITGPSAASPTAPGSRRSHSTSRPTPSPSTMAS